MRSLLVLLVFCGGTASSVTLANAQSGFLEDGGGSQPEDTAPLEVEEATGAQSIISIQPDSAEQAMDEVVVMGRRLRGGVLVDSDPIYTLDSDDIESYGALSIEELFEGLGPLIGPAADNQGGPPILLNGKRISGFREIASYPSEAIKRIEILSEDVALEYGFNSDQRVVNFILHDNFGAFTGNVSVRSATDGGQISPKAEVGRLQIKDRRRVNVDFKYSHDGALLESERNIAPVDASMGDVVGNVTALAVGDEIDPNLSLFAGQTVTIAGAPDTAAFGPVALSDFSAGQANQTDQAPFRSLTPKRNAAAVTATFSDTVFDSISLTATGTLDMSKSESLLGLAGAELVLPAVSAFSPFANDVSVSRVFVERGVLKRKNDLLSGMGSLALSGELGGWYWWVNGKHQRNTSKTNTERGVDVFALQSAVQSGVTNPFAPIDPMFFFSAGDRVKQKTSTSSVDFNAIGKLLELPAGNINASLNAGGALVRQESSFSDRATKEVFSQDRGNAQVSLRAPIFKTDVSPAPIGDLSLNASAKLNFRSDTETLLTYEYGAHWQPSKRITFGVSFTHEGAAPSVQQTDAPVILTPNFRVFDFATGRTVDDVTITRGGAADLMNSDLRRFKANVTMRRPFKGGNLIFNAAYFDQKVDNQIAAFPSLTLDTEAAFPDRFVRDASGNLIAIDARPVNFGEVVQRNIRYGVDFMKPLNAKGGASKAPAARPAITFGGQEGSREGRLGLSVRHTYVLENSLQINEGGQVLDLLSGNAIDARGGMSRHEVTAQARFLLNKFGTRIDYNWRSGRVVNGGSGGDLQFEDFGKLNAQVSWRFKKSQSGREGFSPLSNAQLRLSVDNVFNARQKVMDAAGLTPAGFQPDLLDPLGRTVSLTFNTKF